MTKAKLTYVSLVALSILTLSSALPAILGISSFGDVHAQSFSESFEDGLPTDWSTFRTNLGTVSAGNGVINLKSTAGHPLIFGFGADVTHADVVTEIAAQFINGDAATNLFNNARLDQGQYWTGISQAGEIGIGYNDPDGTFHISMRGTFLPSGELTPNDIVRVRSEFSGPTIVHSAWLDGTDPSTGATITWTDPLDRYPSGNVLGIGLSAPNNSDAEVNIHSYSVTVVPEPSGIPFLLTSLLGVHLVVGKVVGGRGGLDSLY